MGGILTTGRQYATSATTGAITGAGNAEKRRSARMDLELNRRAMEQNRQFQEAQLKLQRETALRQRNASMGMAIGVVGGAAVGGPLGAIVGGTAGYAIGGLF